MSSGAQRISDIRWDDPHFTTGYVPILAYAQSKTAPQQGASTIVFAATSPLLAEIGGVYLRNNDISPLDDAPKPIDFGTEPIVTSDVVPHAVGPESAQRLWELSEQLLKA